MLLCNSSNTTAQHLLSWPTVALRQPKILYGRRLSLREDVSLSINTKQLCRRLAAEHQTHTHTHTHTNYRMSRALTCRPRGQLFMPIYTLLNAWRFSRFAKLQNLLNFNRLL